MNYRTLVMCTLAMGALFGAGCQKTVNPSPTTENRTPAVTTTAQTQTATTSVQTPSDGVSTTTATQKIETTKPSAKPAAETSPIPKGPITVYVGLGCPHCARVEAHALETGMDKKIPMIFKEVFNDQDNADEFLGIAEKCGLDVNNLGVPVMWDGAKCTEGEQDIMKFIDLATQAYAKRK